MKVPYDCSKFYLLHPRPSNGEIGDRRSRTDDGLTELYCIVWQALALRFLFCKEALLLEQFEQIQIR